MQFDSLKYILYLAAVVLVYYLVPPKCIRIRTLWLLAVSYFFYMSWNATYFLLIITSTLITYLCGLIVNPEIKNKSKLARKLALAVCVLCNIGILVFFKYFTFFGDTINTILEMWNLSLKLPRFDVLLPVGISFFTLQALGYAIDVYRGKCKTEKDFGKYAVFVSFFPQLVAGPIERAGNLLRQFNVPHYFNYENFKQGLPLIVWGLFKKMLIADRIAVAINTVYNNPGNHSGSVFIFATVLFAIQIYCDFSAYSNIASGSARLLGFELVENFKTPYLSRSVKEYWGRWHISLSTWFRDYLYIPLGGNRKGKVRKTINLMAVFLVSGLWHGADWTFVIWGALNGVFQIIGEIKNAVLAKLTGKIKPRASTDDQPRSDNERALHAFSVLFKTAVTFVLICSTRIFFRANTFGDALYICREIVTNLSIHHLADGTLLQLGLDSGEWSTAIIAVIILAVVDIQSRRREENAGELLSRQLLVVRWAVLYIMIFYIIIYGYYGFSYVPQKFLYFQF